MERRKFISNICLGCIGITFGGAALNSCSQMKSVNAFAQEGYLVIDKSEFIDKDSNKEFDSIIITSNSLKKPIILFHRLFIINTWKNIRDIIKQRNNNESRGRKTISRIWPST